MKYFKNLLLICCLSFFLFASEEEEIKTMTINGIIYKIDSASGNLTPLNEIVEENSVMAEVKDIKDSASSISIENSSDSEVSQKDDNNSTHDSNFYANFGQLSPLGDISNTHDAGTSIGFRMNLPKKFTIFKKEFSTGIELNFSELGTSCCVENINGKKDIKINSIIMHLMTDIGNLPIDFNFGIALADHNKKAWVGAGLIDISYKLPIKIADLSLVLRLSKIVDVQDGFELDFGALDSYSLYFKYGQSFNF